MAGALEQLSAIIMKLLGKERGGPPVVCKPTFERCLAQWSPYGRIDPVPLGAHDPSDRALIFEQLCGRERQIEALLASESGRGGTWPVARFLERGARLEWSARREPCSETLHGGRIWAVPNVFRGTTIQFTRLLHPGTEKGHRL
jgi:hypothetical protein